MDKIYSWFAFWFHGRLRTFLLNDEAETTDKIVVYLDQLMRIDFSNREWP